MNYYRFINTESKSGNCFIIQIKEVSKTEHEQSKKSKFCFKCNKKTNGKILVKNKLDICNACLNVLRGE